MALSNSAIARAALVIIFGFFTSGVLGLVRTVVLATQFGASEPLDAFYAAQRIPEVIFVLVAGGALGSSFIPVYARWRQRDVDHAWRLASTVMTLATIAAGLLAGIVILLADVLVSEVLMPGSSSAVQALTVDMTRLMMITPVIFSISGLVMGILQTHGLFFLPAIAASMNSIGIIIGALVFAPLMAAAPYTPLEASLAQSGIRQLADLSALPVDQVGNASVLGLAVGAVLSALLHLAVQIPGLFQVRARITPQLDYRLDGVITVLKLMGPRVLGVAVVQVNFIVNIILTDGMVSGSLSALTVAFTLMFTVLGVIGQSIGSAVFPTLAALLGEENYDGFKDRLSSAMRSVLFLAIPATVGLILLGEPLISLFESGAWTVIHTRATAWALGFYALGISGFALLEVLPRAFYALEDTWTPVLIGVGAIVANIIMSVILIDVVGSPGNLARGPFAGLALANASTTLVEAAVLWWLLSRRVNRQGTISGIDDARVLRSAGKTLIASLIMGAVILACLNVLPLTGFLLGVVCAIVGLITFFLAAALLRMEEIQTFTAPVMRRLRRSSAESS